ncbi:uncharacterized protein F4807DRAFT_367636 [Annulohypoxylon truncatum]|uniref:uncharacterized protein n=1 Tax=Annulohypoxylon truncatum TaxID=327061 RepID=UPI0020077096|nr:uncharacterized protein F4807DRAFT_367636 [Annulohypoxylon truncatum]KAI1212347.1 hypothetical protein F4807DRAFT_367636 [Annulohypoxylon truncatum]
MSSKDNDGIWRPVASFDKNEIQWPLSFSLQSPLEGAPRRKWWEHTYYRGPENQSVQILYSTDASNSELIAQQFLNEPVLGFDMEWPWDNIRKVEGKVALIQIACKDKIALFHIALHNGKTTEELIVPSLRRIIESAHIMKTGVAIMSGDFRKLTGEFPLQPRGVFELSHLYNLVTFGSRNLREVNTRLRKLSLIAEDHLGLPLDKGPIRTSNWNLPLDDKQKTYAANDAYASYMLFHCMNAKRLTMSPKLPLPKLAESYLPFRIADIVLTQLEVEADGGKVKVLTAMDFFVPPQPRDDQSSRRANEGNNSTESLTRQRIQQKLDQLRRGHSYRREKAKIISPDELYQRLAKHRDTVAATQGCHPHTIAPDTVLEVLARERPNSFLQIVRIKGLDKSNGIKYGNDWLRIIQGSAKEHHSKHLKPSVSGIPANSHPKDMFQQLQPHPSDQPSKRMRTTEANNSEELVPSVPTASTGLSFQFNETRLDEVPVEKDDGVHHNESHEPALGSPSPLKRKRTECTVPSALELTSVPNPSEVPAPASVDEAAQPESLSFKQKLLRRKLDAYVKSVVCSMSPKPTQPIVSEATLHCLVTTLPRTLDEFHEVPGIEGFFQACQGVKKDLWLTFSTWTRTSGLVPSS